MIEILILMYIYVSLICAALGHAIKKDLNFFIYILAGICWPITMLIMINDVKEMEKNK